MTLLGTLHGPAVLGPGKQENDQERPYTTGRDILSESYHQELSMTTLETPGSESSSSSGESGEASETSEASEGEAGQGGNFN